MAKHRYVASVFARIPRRGDEPILNVSVDAEGAVDAIEKASKQAKQKGVQHTYISVRRA